MFISPSHSHLMAVALYLALGTVSAQSTALILEDGFPALLSDTLADEPEPPDPYAPLNTALGGDSVRFCKGIACSGRIEDHYPEGTLQHKGYYGDGRLIVYSNYHPNGRLEREFTAQSNVRCTMRTWYTSGQLRSETHYVDGVARTFTEHYANGQVRYTEEKHPSQPYYKVMDLFAPDGTPVSTLHLADKKRVIFEQREYWPGGQMRAAGRSQFDPHRYDSRRIGAWTYYDRSGRPVMEEHYVDGKIHETADL